MSSITRITHEGLQRQLWIHYLSKEPLLVNGTFGIGKSWTVRQVAREIAKEKGREYVEWNQLSFEERVNVIENPGRFFVMKDSRASEMDPTDFKGIPEKRDGFHVWEPPQEVHYFSQDKADGILFLDEYNHGHGQVQSTLQKLIHTREAGDTGLNSNVGIFGAGNLLSDRSNAKQVNEAFQDRASQFILEPPTPETWEEWATKAGISPGIIGYVKFSGNLHSPAIGEPQQKSVTPRGYEKLSELIEIVEQVENQPSTSTSVFENVDKRDVLYETAAGRLGEGIAAELVPYLYLSENYSAENLFQNPETVDLPLAPEETDTRSAIISNLVTRYENEEDSEEKAGKLESILVLANRFRIEVEKGGNGNEHAIMALTLAQRHDPDLFKKKAINSEAYRELAPKVNRILNIEE